MKERTKRSLIVSFTFSLLPFLLSGFLSLSPALGGPDVPGVKAVDQSGLPTAMDTLRGAGGDVEENAEEVSDLIVVTTDERVLPI